MGWSGIAWAALGVLVACGDRRPLPVTPPTAPPAVIRSAPRLLRWTPAPPVASRLAPEVAPIAYRLDLDLSDRVRGWSGTVDIDVQVKVATDVIRIHAENLVVNVAVVEQAGARHDAAIEPDFERGAVLLRLPARLATGPARIALRFTRHFLRFGPLGDDTRDVGEEGILLRDDRNYLFTQFEPIAARRAFPCFDEPHIRTPWTVTMTIGASDRGFANVPEVREEQLADGRKRIHFAATPPLPTYLVGFAAGPFQVAEYRDGSLRVRIIADDDSMQFAKVRAEKAAELIHKGEALLGIAFPYPKLDIVRVPGHRYGGMENAGLITISSDVWVIPRELGIADHTLAHEIAHHWMGNLVGFAGWEDLWLAEALAVWLADRLLPPPEPSRTLIVEDTDWRRDILHRDERGDLPPVRRAVADDRDAIMGTDAIDAHTMKVPAVLRMIEHWLGEERFLAAVRRYLTDNAHRSVSMDALARALAAVEPRAGEVLASFLRQPGVPMIRAEQRCEGQKMVLALSQVPVRPAGSLRPAGDDARAWTVPVCARMRAGRACGLADRDGGRIELPGRCADFVHLDAGGHGYYRYARTDGGPLVDPRSPPHLTRAEIQSLADNLVTGLTTAQSTPAAVLRDLAALAAVRDPDSLSPVVQALEWVWSVVPPDALPAFGRYLDAHLGARARADARLDRNHDIVEQRRRRPLLLLVADLGADPVIRGQARALFVDWLTRPVGADPGLDWDVLRLAGRTGDPALLDLIVAAVEREMAREIKPSTLRHWIDDVAIALSAFEDPELLESAVRRLAPHSGVLTGKIGRGQSLSPRLLRRLWQQFAADPGAFRWRPLLLPRREKQDGRSVQPRTIAIACDAAVASALERALPGADSLRGAALAEIRQCAAIRDLHAAGFRAALSAP